jgi:hypothetical protein
VLSAYPRAVLGYLAQQYEFAAIEVAIYSFASIVHAPLFSQHITETNRTRLVLFGTQNRTSGPYLAALNRIIISVMAPNITRT